MDVHWYFTYLVRPHVFRCNDDVMSSVSEIIFQFSFRFHVLDHARVFVDGLQHVEHPSIGGFRADTVIGVPADEARVLALLGPIQTRPAERLNEKQVLIFDRLGPCTAAEDVQEPPGLFVLKDLVVEARRQLADALGADPLVQGRFHRRGLRRFLECYTRPFGCYLLQRLFAHGFSF